MIKAVFAGGGTAGHINPALAIAGYLKEKQPDSQILFVGNKNSMEEKLVKRAGFEFETIDICGFKRSLSPKACVQNAATAFKAAAAVSASKKIIRRFNPDVCIGTGGYVSGPVVRAAASLGVKTLIHEQNAFPGVTTKMLSKKADVVMLAIADAAKRLDSDCNTILTGNPIRGEVLKAQPTVARRTLGLDERPVVLSFGGSLGARAVNEAVAPIVARSGKDGRYQHIHAYGQYGGWFPETVKKLGTDIDKCSNLDIREFINNMDVCLAAADIVICRAGAITLSELQATGTPSILIPSPNVAENHQYYNALALADAGAALLIEEKDLSADKLACVLDSALTDREKLERMAENAKRMAITDSRERIYSQILEQVNSKR